MTRTAPHDASFTLTSYASSFVRKRLSQAESALREAHDWLSATDDVDGDSALTGLAHAKRVRRLATRVERAFEEAAIAQMHHDAKAYHVGDGFTAVLRPAHDRRDWKHADVMDDLVDVVIAKMAARYPAVAPSTVKNIVTEAMWDVHRAGRIEWRSTDLREFGLDPDDYSRTVSAPASLDMRGTQTHARVRPARKVLP